MLVLVPLPTQGCDRCAPSYAPTGEPTLSGAPLSPCFAAESTREGTLMSLPEGAPKRSGSGAKSGSLSSYPENAAAPAQYPSAERRYRPKVTSGCPKRSEGGSPVGTRTNTAFRAEANKGSEPSGPPPARICPSRPAHPEEHAGRRHRSSPRPARVRRLHAHRWRLRG